MNWFLRFMVFVASICSTLSLSSAVADQFTFVRRSDGRLGLALLSEAGELSEAIKYWNRSNIHQIVGQPHSAYGRIMAIVTDEANQVQRLVGLHGHNGEMFAERRLETPMDGLVCVSGQLSGLVAIREVTTASYQKKVLFYSMNLGTQPPIFLDGFDFILSEFIRCNEGIAYFQRKEGSSVNVYEVNIALGTTRVVFTLPDLVAVSDIVKAPVRSPIHGAYFIRLKPDFIEAPEHLFLSVPGTRTSSGSISPDHHLWRFTVDIEDGPLSKIDQFGNYWMITKHPQQILHRTSYHPGYIGSTPIRGSNDEIVALAGGDCTSTCP